MKSANLTRSLLGAVVALASVPPMRRIIEAEPKIIGIKPDDLPHPPRQIPTTTPRVIAVEYPLPERIRQRQAISEARYLAAQSRQEAKRQKREENRQRSIEGQQRALAKLQEAK
jgi:hypothetical protein